MYENNLTRCAVCCKLGTPSEFGDGVKCPKTTCLECYLAIQQRNADEKKKEKKRGKNDTIQ